MGPRLGRQRCQASGTRRERATGGCGIPAAAGRQPPGLRRKSRL